MYLAVVGTQRAGNVLEMKTLLRYDTMHADDWRIGRIAVSLCHLVVILDLYWAYIVVHSWTTQP